jgi:hypothetical protein
VTRGGARVRWAYVAVVALGCAVSGCGGMAVRRPADASKGEGAAKGGTPAAVERAVPEVRGARAALRRLAEQTLARPQPATRLFVEAYFQRSLAATHDVLLDTRCSAQDSALARRALASAVAFADTFAACQTAQGYWRLGYDRGWIADMAAAAGIFVAVAPHVSPARRARYEEAVDRFTAALEHDHLYLDSGDVGIGWPGAEKPPQALRTFSSDMGWSDEPYIVATALAGVSVNAWSYRQQGRDADRQRALSALAATLREVKPDGSLPRLEKHEGVYTVASYVGEGWMAGADLDSTMTRTAMEPALARHVAWLLRTQRVDGTWDSGQHGDGARAPGCVDFLVWWAARHPKDAAVQQALQHAGAALVRAVQREGSPLHAAGDDAEIQRAHTGRALAALVLGAAVP